MSKSPCTVVTVEAEGAGGRGRGPRRGGGSGSSHEWRISVADPDLLHLESKQLHQPELRAQEEEEEAVISWTEDPHSGPD